MGCCAVCDCKLGILEMNVINLAANYSAVYEGWSNGRAVYTIL